RRLPGSPTSRRTIARTVRRSFALSSGVSASAEVYANGWSTDDSEIGRGDRRRQGSRTVGRQRLAELVRTKVWRGADEPVIDVGKDRAGIHRAAAGGERHELWWDRHRRRPGHVEGRETCRSIDLSSV